MRLVRHADVLQRVHDYALVLGGVPVEKPLVRAAPHGHYIADAELEKHVVLLPYDRRAPRRLAVAHLRHVLAVEEYFAFHRLYGAVQAFEQRRLAAAVRPYQADELAALSV